MFAKNCPFIPILIFDREWVAVLVMSRYWKKWETEDNYTYTQAQNQFLKVLTLRPSNAQKE